MPLWSSSPPGAAPAGFGRATPTLAKPAAAAWRNARRFTCGHLPRLLQLCKHALVLIAAGAIVSGCAPGPRSESSARVTVDGVSPVDVRVSLSAARASQQSRWQSAAESAVRQHLRMVGSVPATAITIVDRTGHGDSLSIPADAIAVVAPQYSSFRGMAVERAV